MNERRELLGMGSYESATTCNSIPTGWKLGDERKGNQVFTCSHAAADNLSVLEGSVKDLARLASVSAGQDSMHIGDTGMQAMHVVVAADSVPAAGTMAARQTGYAKNQQLPEVDGRSGDAESVSIAEVGNQQVVGTVLGHVRA